AGFGGAEGIARAYDAKGTLLWQLETPIGRNIEHVVYGPMIDNNSSAWIVSWDERLSKIESHVVSSGNPIVRVEVKSRANAIVGNPEYLAIGFDDGSVFLLQGELLSRRINSEEDSEVDEHRSALAEKLRRLRS
ncbi:MAG: hypothetical protein QF684_05290, partial [Candidatus Thalassarchaeaceae archaeon]|nr:hypothetical protein [Candidatus Thalassarchaeaceae archaeon]